MDLVALNNTLAKIGTTFTGAFAGVAGGGDENAYNTALDGCQMKEYFPPFKEMQRSNGSALVSGPYAMSFLGTYLSATKTDTKHLKTSDGSRVHSPAIANIAVDGLCFFPRITGAYPGNKVWLALEKVPAIDDMRKPQGDVRGFSGVNMTFPDTAYFRVVATTKPPHLEEDKSTNHRFLYRWFVGTCNTVRYKQAITESYYSGSAIYNMVRFPAPVLPNLT